MTTLSSILRLVTALVVAAFVISACSPTVNKAKKEIQSANDVVVIGNANILTMNTGQPNATAMATKGDKILAVGDLEKVKAVIGKDYKYVDLKGATVTPGFIESHQHLAYFSGTLSMVDVSPLVATSLKEVLELIKKGNKPDNDGWINFFYIDPSLYPEKRGPTIQELDALYPDTPVMVHVGGGDGAYVNSKAYEVKGITKETPNPDRGTYEKDAKGEFTGYLKGEGALMVVGKNFENNVETNLVAGKYQATLGFTTVTEMALTRAALGTLKEVTETPGFQLRVIGALYTPHFEEILEAAENISDWETHLFKVPFFKYMMDGATQSGTSFFSEHFHTDYAGTVANENASGTQAEVNKLLLYSLKSGFMPAIHVNGDASMDLALNAIDYVRKEVGNSDIRVNLVHLQYVRQDQFDRIAKMPNISTTFFSAHVYYWGDLHRDVWLGPERAANISSISSAIKRDIPYSIHNDAPVTKPDALHTMWVAVNRLTFSGKVLGPDQRITPEQALVGYTSGAAYALGMEDQVGTLEVGKMADYVVLEESPLDVDPMKIKDIKIKQTVMGGMTTFLAE